MKVTDIFSQRIIAQNCDIEDSLNPEVFASLAAHNDVLPFNMEHVFFKPWVGKNYKTGGIFGKKILVLGESHYCGGCDQCGLKYSPKCDDLNTEGVVKFYLEGNTNKRTATFRKFERSLVNEETSLGRSNEIWNSLAFFNFLQVAMTDARIAGTPEDYDEGRIAFLEVLEELQPDLIIVWGTTRLWNNLPGKENGWVDGEEFVVDNWSVPNGYYLLKSGKKTRVIAVYHPSTGYSWDWWYKVIAHEL